MLYPQNWYWLFLIVLLMIYWLLCRGPITKKLVLILASTGLLGTLQPEFTVGMLLWTAVVYLAARTIMRPQGPARLKILVTLGLALLGYLASFKYVPGMLTVILDNVSGESTTWLEQNVVLPIGISYITFKFLHYLIDVYRGNLSQHKVVDFVLYSMFFPIIPAGPIERFGAFVENANLQWNTASFSYGIQRIIFGMAKKLLLVDIMLAGVVTGRLHDLIVSGSFEQLAILDIWTFFIASFLYAYLDFSAYSDLAIGTSRLFGFKIRENFNLPILRPNLAEFWKCWHMSLSSWCRDYVYMPVLAKTRKPILAIYVSMMTIGAWHYVNFNWLAWGALHATGLVILMQWRQFSKKRFRGRTNPYPALTYISGTALTFLYVSWVFAFVSISSPVAATQAFVFAVSGWSVL